MNPFMTNEHCRTFARRVACLLGEDVHIIRTRHPDCPRHVVSAGQLRKLERRGAMALVEHTEPAPDRCELDHET